MSEPVAAATPEEGRPRAHEAAARIQAGFRGYRVRKRLQDEREATAAAGDVLPPREEAAPEAPARPTSHEGRRGQGEPQHQPQSTPPQQALEDKSATKIQAGVRGFLVRKRQQAEKAAATRIQAGFRGFRARKLLKQATH